MTFSQQIYYVRQKLYLSRSEMAKEMGVTEQTIYRWEQGRSNPHIASKRKLIALCSKMKIELERAGDLKK